MSDGLNERVAEIFREVVSEDLSIHDDLSAGSVEGWDSLSHVTLIYAIEDEFGIEFTQDEMVDMANIGDLKRLIESKTMEGHR